MPLPLLPLVVGSLVAAAYAKAFRNDNTPPKGVLTPTRQVIYETAIKELKEPEKLRALSKTFSEQGLPAQAEMLEKRAKLRELPDPVKKARKEVFRRAMVSTNVTGILSLANSYEREGATGAAKSLREYAASLPIPVPGETPKATATPVQPAPPPAYSGVTETATPASGLGSQDASQGAHAEEDGEELTEEEELPAEEETGE